MKIHRIKTMKGGWYIGDFLPSAFKTKEFEIGYKFHKKGLSWPVHIHKQITEINFLVHGRMKIQGKILRKGNIFIIKPHEIADPVFLTDCEVIIVKVPSIPSDKFILK